MATSLFPQIAPGERLVGIARLAAAGEAVDEGHNVEYITLENRSVLTRCLSPRMPFTWMINPYGAANLPASTAMPATPMNSWNCATAWTSSAKSM